MRRVILVSCRIALAASGLRARPRPGAAGGRTPNVEFDMMTWPEVKKAMAEGKTTALVYNGGTEQRGPQNVNGGHTLMARETVRAIAVKLGNAIAAPVLPFSPNNASADLPGTIGLTNEIFAAINEQVAEQLIKTGFKNVVLMGDHGGGQQQLGEVAKKLDGEVRRAGHQGGVLRRGLRQGQRRLRQVAGVAGLPDQLARRHPRHLRDALSRRRQGLDAQGTGEGRARRSGAAAGPAPRSRASRASTTASAATAAARRRSSARSSST